MMNYVSITFAVLLCLCSGGCAGVSVYSHGYFPEPPAKPKVRIYMTQSVPSGSFPEKRQRTVKLTVESISSGKEVSWNSILDSATLEFTTLSMNSTGCKIAIVERGNQFAEDEHNRQLLNSGARRLVSLRLEYETGKTPMKLSEVPN